MGENKDKETPTAESTDWRRWVYPLLAIWAVLLLIGLAYLKMSDDDSSPVAVPQVQENIADAEEEATKENELRSEANIKAAQQDAIVGEKAPDFTLASPNGKPITLSDYQGEPVVVEFIATWCPHCQAMAPVYDKVMKKHKDAGYIIIGAAGEPSEVVEEWHNNFLGHPMQGDLALDGSLETARAYGLSGYPTSVFINSDGTIEEIFSGELSESALTEKLAAIGA